MPAQHDEETRVPWLARLILLDAETVALRLEQVRRSGIAPLVPNTWQITLGVLRMWHRVLFRSETIGTCRDQPVRKTLRARLLAIRALRFPFLLRERAVAPWDFSGLLSSPERVRRHLLGAHHDGDQFAYDLEMLAIHADELERLLSEVRAVVHTDDTRSRWLRNLVVFEGYHEALLEAVTRALEGRYRPVAGQNDPDISFLAYLAWCAEQPETPRATLAALGRGTFSLSSAPR